MTTAAAIAPAPAASQLYGFLEAPRTQPLPAGSAWEPLRPLAAMLLTPCDPHEYRAAVEELDREQGEEIARTTEADVANLSETDVAHAYSMLTFLSQKYIYCLPDDLKHVIPRCIGRPWIQAAKRRGAPMTLTYDALVISNFYLRDPSAPPTIDNVDAFVAVNGTEPERGFIRVHMAIEAAGGDLPDRMLTLGETLEAAQDTADRTRTLNVFLAESHTRLQQMTHLVGQMWKQVGTETYWKQVRVTLMGSPEEVFPAGVRIDSTDVTLFRKGGSGAQSPLLHAVDRFFAVDHIDPELPKDKQSQRQMAVLKSLEAPPEHARRFITEQITFMCERHRRFHERLHQVRDVRNLVLAYGDAESRSKYNDCVTELERWRKVHQKMTHKYIAERVEEGKSATPGTTSATDGGMHIVGTERGAQHSNYKPLLAQLIRETHLSLLTNPKGDGTAETESTKSQPRHSGFLQGLVDFVSGRSLPVYFSSAMSRWRANGSEPENTSSFQKM